MVVFRSVMVNEYSLVFIHLCITKIPDTNM